MEIGIDRPRALTDDQIVDVEVADRFKVTGPLLHIH